MKEPKALLALDKLGAVGAFLAAAAAPCCFPLLGMIGTALGLGALLPWRGYMDYVIQGFALISAAGGFLAFRRHHRVWPLALGLASAGIIFFGFYVRYDVSFIYAGLAGLGASAFSNMLIRRQRDFRARVVELKSRITCPHCGHQKDEMMPTDACLYFYECQNCRATLRPKPGDCCIFCSYGSSKCPPIQSENKCCLA